jgi:hypothetical protein
LRQLLPVAASAANLQQNLAFELQRQSGSGRGLGSFIAIGRDYEM